MLQISFLPPLAPKNLLVLARNRVEATFLRPGSGQVPCEGEGHGDAGHKNDGHKNAGHRNAFATFGLQGEQGSWRAWVRGCGGIVDC